MNYIQNYDKRDFDTLFFSTGNYFTINPVTGPFSPDGEWVYGSLRDYYRDQSLNKLDIIGKIGSDRSIINPEDPNNPGKPQWIYMPEVKSHYSGLGSNYLTVNPLYGDPQNNDFNLQWGSGCIDAGHPSAIYNDPDGTRNDMGAKYYDQSPIVPFNFTIEESQEFHPLLQWQGAPHLRYKVYALYEYYGTPPYNEEYNIFTEYFEDESV